MPQIIGNRDPPLEIYLALSYAALLLLWTSGSHPASIMEHIYANYSASIATITGSIVLPDETKLNSYSVDKIETKTPQDTPLAVSTPQIMSSDTDKPLGLHSDEMTHKLLRDVSESLIIVNTVCCLIVMAYKLSQYLVIGTLRMAEKQILRETFWDYFLQKGLFVSFIVGVKGYEKRAPWAIWYTALGAIILLSRLCKDRFESLSSSPATKRWPLIKICLLMFSLLFISIYYIWDVYRNPWSKHSLFLYTDVVYVLIFLTSVITRLAIIGVDMSTKTVWETRSILLYYTDLVYAVSMLIIDLIHHIYILFTGYPALIIKGWCLLRIHTLILEIRRRYRKHENYLYLLFMVKGSFALASKEEMNDSKDECAICWDDMETARKLPCGHLFHNTCLLSWLEQDASCPTCRSSLKTGLTLPSSDSLSDEIETQSESEEEFVEARADQRNHFFHFDSSRYTNNIFLNWFHTNSIEGFM